MKQAGNGPSRRHIQGSKIAKGLQSVKVLVNYGPFGEKNLKVSMPKKLKVTTLWDFSTSILSLNSIEIEGGPLVGKIFETNVAQCRKKLEEGPFSLAWYCVTRKKSKNHFDSVR